MLRLKVVFLSMFAVAAFGAVASSSALADTCTGGVQAVFCTSPGNLPIINLAVSGESGLALLAGKIGIVEIKIHCKDDKFAGTLKSLGLIVGEIDFLNCLVERPSTCATTSLLLAEVNILAESELKGVATGSKNPAKQEFLTLPLTGTNCPINGNLSITGTQELEFPKGGEGLVQHEIVAKKSGSKLKILNEPATFSGSAKIRLDSNTAWLIMTGE